MKRKYWTEEERIKLTNLYPNMIGADLAKLFCCSIKSIYSQASLLGLKKDIEFITNVARDRACLLIMEVLHIDSKKDLRLQIKVKDKVII